MKWYLELYFTWGDSSIHRIRLAKMSIRPKRTQFCWKMLCFQQLTQLNLVIAVENTPTRASTFNLSDPAVVINERAVTSRHRNEEYSSNPHPVSGSIKFPTQSGTKCLNFAHAKNGLWSVKWVKINKILKILNKIHVSKHYNYSVIQ